MDRVEVAIVGAGPVGLLLGCLLAQRSIDVRLIEAAEQRSQHSRAIGIHPPGLLCLARAGVADELLARGVKVRRGHAFARGKRLGSVDFAGLARPHDFVLSVPQAETERVLERALCDRAGSVLRRGLRARTLDVGSGRLLVTAREGGCEELSARFVVACEGKHSLLRAAAGIGFEGGPYARRFMMVDARDDTPFGTDAAVFLTRHGLIESFPLPAGQRRWVVEVDRLPREPDCDALGAHVRMSTGFGFATATVSMESRFTAERYLARRFVRGPLVLAGDAAHVMSPIGGQGMNVGWLDAVALADALEEALRRGADASSALAGYARERREAARRALRRAHLYTEVGCSGGGALSRSVLGAVLEGPLRDYAARMFTMSTELPAALQAEPRPAPRFTHARSRA
jgi:2-polyprenyl-6-methoxyphenol hydroxylase-like FAD-dependent oxidoreductase